MQNKQLEAMPVGTKFKPEGYVSLGSYYVRNEKDVSYFSNRATGRVFTHNFSEFSASEKLVIIEEAKDMTFKVGDKVRVKQGVYLYSPKGKRARDKRTVGTVTRLYDNYSGGTEVNVRWDGDDSDNTGFPIDKLEPAEVKPTEPLAETLAEVEAKIQAAVKESGELAQNIQNARGTLKALEDQKAEADKRILEFGKQTVKLKELEAKPQPRVKVGDTVKSLRNGYVGQYGVVTEVRNYPNDDLPSVLVNGAFYDRHGNASFQLYLYGTEYEVAK